MGKLGQYWQVVNFIGRGVAESTQAPRTDKLARTNVTLWSVAMATSLFSLTMDFLVPPHPAFLAFGLAAFALDFAMLWWAIAGLRYRRRIRD